MMHLICPQNFAKALFSISLGTVVIPRRNEKQTLCKILGGKVHYGRCANGVWQETQQDKTKEITSLNDVIPLSCPSAYLALQHGSFVPRKWPAPKCLYNVTHCNLLQYYTKVASTIKPGVQMGPLCRILHVQPALSGLQTSRSLIVKLFFIQFDLKWRVE